MTIKRKQIQNLIGITFFFSDFAASLKHLLVSLVAELILRLRHHHKSLFFHFPTIVEEKALIHPHTHKIKKKLTTAD
nr:ORF5 [Bearded dragon adenovirus 1]